MSIPPETPEPVGPPAVPTPPPPPATAWAPPSVGWVYPPPPPPAPSRGRLLAVVLGVVAAASALVITAGLLLGPRLVGQPSPRQTTASAQAVPPVGACYEGGGASIFHTGAEREVAVSCDKWHLLETIDAGLVADADAGDWLKPEDPAAHELFAHCEQVAERLLGVHWSVTFTQLILSIPSLSAWRAGALWYRCDLGTTDRVWGPLTSSKGSIQDTAERFTCATWRPTHDGESFEDIEAADCDQPHFGEFVGAFRATYASESDVDYVTAEEKDELGSRCWPLVLGFLDRNDLGDDLTFWYFTPSDKTELDQSVVCLVAANGVRTLTASIEGIGSGPLPLA